MNSVLSNDDELEAAVVEHRAFPKSVQAGIPRLGALPVGWAKLPMGELLRPVVRPVNIRDESEYQLVTARRSRGGIVARERLVGKEILTKTQFETRAGDFLISRRQIAHGACGIVPPELDGALVSGEYDTLLPTRELHPAFLRHLPHSIYFQQTLFHSSTGVHVEKLIFKLDKWLQWPLNTPPIMEQIRIAELLDTWDDAIAAAERLARDNALRCERVTRELFTSAIAGNATNTDWDVCAISDIAEVVGGGTPASTNKLFWGGEIDWCTPTDLTALASRYIDSSSRKITDKGLRASSAALLPSNSVVLCSRASIGECAINTVPMATNQGFQNLVPHDPRETEFVYFMMRAIKTRLLTIAAGSTFLEFTRGELRRLKVAAPPHEQRLKIGLALGLMDDAAWQQKKRATLLRRQKSGLMQKLLTGEWRVAATGDTVALGNITAERLEAAE